MGVYKTWLTNMSHTPAWGPLEKMIHSGYYHLHRREAGGTGTQRSGEKQRRTVGGGCYPRCAHPPLSLKQTIVTKNDNIRRKAVLPSRGLRELQTRLSRKGKADEDGRANAT